MDILPYDFDLLFDIKTVDELKKLLSRGLLSCQDKKIARELMAHYNINIEESKKMNRFEVTHKKLTGVDVSIEISLKEYGFAWIESEFEILFYYGIAMEENDCGDMDYIKFDSAVISKTVDIKDEYDWIDFNEIKSFDDLFFDKSLPFQIHTLLTYYGHENVFGSSYFEGLTYKEITGE